MIGTPANIKLVSKILARQYYGADTPARGWAQADAGPRDRFRLRAMEILEALDEMQRLNSVRTS